MKKALTTLISGAALALTATVASADNKDYVLNTASTGGTYHPVGTAIATLSKVKLLPKQKFSLTAVNSAGSGANVQALASGTAQFAIFRKYRPMGMGQCGSKLLQIPHRIQKLVNYVWASPNTVNDRLYKHQPLCPISKPTFSYKHQWDMRFPRISKVVLIIEWCL